MADISKCFGEIRQNNITVWHCPFKDKCYRYLAPANEFRQAYIEPKFDSKKYECENFWDKDKR